MTENKIDVFDPTALAAALKRVEAWIEEANGVCVSEGIGPKESGFELLEAVRSLLPPASFTFRTLVSCDTTLTLRKACALDCGTYAGNLGPCGTWQLGANGRCAFCDHGEGCHGAPLLVCSECGAPIVRDTEDVAPSDEAPRGGILIAYRCPTHGRRSPRTMMRVDAKSGALTVLGKRVDGLLEDNTRMHNARVEAANEARAARQTVSNVERARDAALASAEHERDQTNRAHAQGAALAKQMKKATEMLKRVKAKVENDFEPGYVNVDRKIVVDALEAAIVELSEVVTWERMRK